MHSWFLDQTLGVLLPVALGGVGWFVTHWVANPLLAVNRLRTAVHEELYRTANVGPSADLDELKRAQAALRGLAAQLSAVNASALTPVRWSFSLLRLHIQLAVIALTAFSNSLLDREGHRALFKRRVEDALRLPRSDTDEYINGIEKTLGLNDQKL
jgi:hypothetical protein